MGCNVSSLDGAAPRVPLALAAAPGVGGVGGQLVTVRPRPLHAAEDAAPYKRQAHAAALKRDEEDELAAQRRSLQSLLVGHADGVPTADAAGVAVKLPLLSARGRASASQARTVFGSTSVDDDRHLASHSGVESSSGAFSHMSSSALSTSAVSVSALPRIGSMAMSSTGSVTMASHHALSKHASNSYEGEPPQFVRSITAPRSHRGRVPSFDPTSALRTQTIGSSNTYMHDVAASAARASAGMLPPQSPPQDVRSTSSSVTFSGSHNVSVGAISRPVAMKGRPAITTTHVRAAPVQPVGGHGSPDSPSASIKRRSQERDAMEDVNGVQSAGFQPPSRHAPPHIARDAVTSAMPAAPSTQPSEVSAAAAAVQQDVIPIQDAETYGRLYYMYSETNAEYRAYKDAWEAEQAVYRADAAEVAREKSVGLLRSRSIYTPEPPGSEDTAIHELLQSASPSHGLSPIGVQPLSPASPGQAPFSLVTHARALSMSGTPTLAPRVLSRVCSPIPGALGAQLVGASTALCLMIETSRPNSVCASPVPGYKVVVPEGMDATTLSPVGATSPSLYALGERAGSPFSYPTSAPSLTPHALSPQRSPRTEEGAFVTPPGHRAHQRTASTASELLNAHRKAAAAAAQQRESELNMHLGLVGGASPGAGMNVSPTPAVISPGSAVPPIPSRHKSLERPSHIMHFPSTAMAGSGVSPLPPRVPAGHVNHSQSVDWRGVESRLHRLAEDVSATSASPNQMVDVAPTAAMASISSAASSRSSRSSKAEPEYAVAVAAPVQRVVSAPRTATSPVSSMQVESSPFPDAALISTSPPVSVLLTSLPPASMPIAVPLSSGPSAEPALLMSAASSVVVGSAAISVPVRSVLARKGSFRTNGAGSGAVLAVHPSSVTAASPLPVSPGALSPVDRLSASSTSPLPGAASVSPAPPSAERPTTVTIVRKTSARPTLRVQA